MDYEALKDQWSEVEDRDGIRLSWNTFPSTRMVSPVLAHLAGHYLSRSRKPPGLLCPLEPSTPP